MCGTKARFDDPDALPPMTESTIRVGVGGWDYDPWRDTFYPPKLPRSKQLDHMAGRLTAIEINATYYKLQTPELFERWAKAAPEGFRFAIKGSRFCTNRKVLGDRGRGAGPLLRSGIGRARRQARPDPLAVHGDEEIRAGRFRGLPGAAAAQGWRDFRSATSSSRGTKASAIPSSSRWRGRRGGNRLRRFRRISLFRRSVRRPRLCPAAAQPAGGGRRAIRRPSSTAGPRSPGAGRAGESPAGFPYVAEPRPGRVPREVYVFFIAGAKERNPAAAEALIGRLQLPPHRQMGRGTTEGDGGVT